MLYGTSGDVRALLGDPTETQVPASLISTTRTKATGLVDSYLEKAYPNKAPWTASGDVPVLVASLTDDLAVYYVKRSKHPAGTPLEDGVKAEYWDKPLATLEKISKREIMLPELTSGLADDVKANKQAYTPIFDLDNETAWVVDPDEQQDISDSRA